MTHLGRKLLIAALFAAIVGAAAIAGPREDVVSATRLPEVADGLRQLGVPESDIGLMLDAARNKGLGAGEAETTLESVQDTEKQGHMDNLGSFVKSKIEEGLRGKELAAAIHAEKANREKEKNGLGKPDEPPGQAGDHGRSGEAHERNDARDKGGKGKGGGGGKGHGKKGGR